MKISTFFMFILIVSGIFFAFSHMVSEANDQYPDSHLNSSEWEDNYDYIDDINSTISPIEKSLKTIQDDEAGWFSKLTAGIAAIPYALLITPQVTFGGMVFGGNIVTDFFSVWGLPQTIVTIGIVILFIWGISKLISRWDKWEF